MEGNFTSMLLSEHLFINKARTYATPCGHLCSITPNKLYSFTIMIHRQKTKRVGEGEEGGGKGGEGGGRREGGRAVGERGGCDDRWRGGDTERKIVRVVLRARAPGKRVQLRLIYV